jgi:CDP-diacylglycerol--serine O-phosphatidyltransferase
VSLKKYLAVLGLPGLISVLALLSAWVAIVLVLGGSLKYSVIFAVTAFFLDSLDGYTARRMNRVSEIGRQLDSMVDLVAYSIYSAILVYRVLIPGLIGAVVGYIILVFGLLRLIRFNADGYIEDSSGRYYRGVVVCHMALATISFLLLSSHFKIPSLIMALTLVILSVLQLSNIRTRKTGTLPFWYSVAALLIVGAIAWLP